MARSSSRNLGNETCSPTMKLQPDDLKQIASLTLQRYDDRADEFWRGTRSHDVSYCGFMNLSVMRSLSPMASYLV
jgi:hypothetical protein